MSESTNKTHISGSLVEVLRLGEAMAVEVAASSPERLAGVTIFPQRCVKDEQV